MGIEFSVPGIGIFALLSVISFSMAVYVLFGATQMAMMIMTLLVLVASALLYYFFVNLGKGRWAKSLSNHDAQQSEAGYVSHRDKAHLLGRLGKAHTPLRPAGIAWIEEEYVDVVTEGDFYEAGTPLCVVAVEGARVVVRATDISSLE